MVTERTRRHRATPRIVAVKSVKWLVSHGDEVGPDSERSRIHHGGVIVGTSGILHRASVDGLIGGEASEEVEDVEVQRHWAYGRSHDADLADS